MMTGIKELSRLVRSYERGAIPLHQLVNDLQSALNGMQRVPGAFRVEFLKYWSGLEEVNALMLDSGQNVPSPAYQNIIADALAGIDPLLTRAPIDDIN